jgi:hypothetical protein
LIGVSRVEQVADNIAALAVSLTLEQRGELDRASAPEQRMLYSLFTPSLRQHAVFGGSSVTAAGRLHP